MSCQFIIHAILLAFKIISIHLQHPRQTLMQLGIHRLNVTQRD